VLGRGGGLVVSALAYCSEDLSSDSDATSLIWQFYWSFFVLGTRRGILALFFSFGNFKAAFVSIYSASDKCLSDFLNLRLKTKRRG